MYALESIINAVPIFMHSDVCSNKTRSPQTPAGWLYIYIHNSVREKITLSGAAVTEERVLLESGCANYLQKKLPIKSRILILLIGSNGIRPSEQQSG
jgi:hypothetical protein